MRTRAKPLGRKDSLAVFQGNLLAARAFVLLLLVAAKGCWWVLEQPSTSLMEAHPLFQYLLKILPVTKKIIYMSNYGSPTKKRTILYSSPMVHSVTVDMLSSQKVGKGSIVMFFGFTS